MLNLHDGRGPHEATLRVKQLETVSFMMFFFVCESFKAIRPAVV